MGPRSCRISRLGLLLGSLAASLAAPVAATPFRGTLSLQHFGGFGPVDPIEIAGQGDAAPAPGGAVSIPASVFATTRTESVPCCNARPLVEVAVGTPALNRTGTFRPGGGPKGGFGGLMPLEGVYRLGLFGPPPFAFISVPLLVGQPGSIIFSGPSGISVAVSGTDWTTGAVTLTIPPFGERPTTLRVTGGDFRTPGGLGQLLLVSPAVVHTNLAGAERFVLDARLELHFVPEPGASLLLGLGLAGLAAARRPSPRATFPPRRTAP